jgi:hypothetical protein
MKTLLNALFRIASLCKPITAAAIRQLANAGRFRPSGHQRRVFNLTVNGVNNCGLPNVERFFIRVDTNDQASALS